MNLILFRTTDKEEDDKKERKKERKEKPKKQKKDEGDESEGEWETVKGGATIPSVLIHYFIILYY